MKININSKSWKKISQLLSLKEPPIKDWNKAATSNLALHLQESNPWMKRIKKNSMPFKWTKNST